MISIQLNHEDLNHIRFAYSPLMEVSMSFWVLYDPCDGTHFADWIAETRRALAGIELPYMQATVLFKHFIADFMTLPPASPASTFEDEIERLRAVPPGLIRKNIEYIVYRVGQNVYLDHYLTHPHEAVEHLIQEIRVYWERAIAPHWQRISLILEKDILYRARQMALYGIGSTFSDISHFISYQTQSLYINRGSAELAPTFYNYAYQSDGAGLYLVPTFFKTGNGLSWQITEDFKPMLVYAARGTGLWQQSNTAEPSEAMEIIVGSGKSRLMQSLLDPSTTGELADKLAVTAGAVSQHLNRLTQAGLVVSHRQGNYVYHELSERGKKLIELFAE